MPTLEDVRAAIVGAHPHTARVQAGGAGRCLAIAQIVADVASARGQALLAELETPEGRARSQRRRAAVARRERSGLAREMALQDARREALERLEATARAWDADDRARERAAAAARARRAA